MIQSYLNPNYVEIGSWCLLKTTDGFSVTFNEENNKITTLRYNGKCNQEAVTDIDVRNSDKTKRTMFSLPGEGTKESVVTYHNTYPERIMRATNGLGLAQSYTYDEYGNITSQTVEETVNTNRMCRQYNYDFTDSRLDKNAVKTMTDEAGCTLTADYNVETGSLKKTILPGTNQNIDYTYTGIDELLSEIGVQNNTYFLVFETSNKLHYNKGYLTRMEHNGYTYDFMYDGFGRITNVYVGGSRIIAAAYTDSGINIDGVTGAVNKTVVGYFDIPSQDATLCGRYLCGQAKVASYKAGSNNVYASYYDKYGMLLKVRHAIDVELDHAFTEAEDYVTVTEEKNFNKHTVKYTVGETRYEYEYDVNSGELKSQTEYSGEDPVLKFEPTGKDDFGRTNGIKYTIDNSEEQCYTYTYKSAYENTVKSVQLPSNKQSEITTDGFGRIKTRTLNTTTAISEEYEYETRRTNNVNVYTTPLVSSLVLRKDGRYEKLQYTYYANNNITQIHDASGTLLNIYEYDGLNRLVREYEASGKTTVWLYDKGGNIRFKKVVNGGGAFHYTAFQIINMTTAGTQIDYSYYTSGNKDRLKSYNGSEDIEYDDIGNPQKWFKHTENGSRLKYELSWSHVSELNKITDTDSNAEYTYAYNDQGIRISKTANGTDHKYYVDGSRIIGENRTTGSTVDKLRYYYDALGVCGFSYNGSDYYYQKNIQGDIIGVYDSTGKSKAEYGYDASGKCQIKTDIDGIGTLNPFRYRGYYYDNETGLYYLQTRYYDAEVCRFISPDTLDYLDPESINGLNLYAYCLNNPVMYYDPSGHFVLTVIFAIVGMALGGLLMGFSAYNNGIRGQELAGNILAGVSIGGFIGIAAGLLASILLPMIGVGGAAAVGGGAAVISSASAGTIMLTGGAVVVGGSIIGIGATTFGNIVFSQSRPSGKETANDAPSWAKQENIDPNMPAEQSAKRLMNNKYGPGNWEKGPGSEFNKIKKWIERYIKRFRRN